MRHRPRSLVAVLILTALSLIALTLTGLVEWISAVLFLLMEFMAEFLRPRRRKNTKKDRPRASRRPLGAAKAPPAPTTIRRVDSRRRLRLRRPLLRRHGRRPGVSSD